MDTTHEIPEAALCGGLFQESVVPMAVYGSDGSCRLANAAFRHHLDLPEQARVPSLTRLVRPERTARSLLRALESQTPPELRRLRLRAGSGRVLEDWSLIQPVTLGGVRLLLLSLGRWTLGEEGAPTPGLSPGALRIHVNDLTVDLAKGQARLGNRRLPLTPTEFRLLAYLAQNAGQVLTHQQLIAHLWPSGGSRARLFVHIRRLRRKIEADPDLPRRLITVWGTGYLLRAS